MKTKSSINQIVKVSIASVTMILAFAIAPVQAASDNAAK
jgi:hypothetical protein